MKSLKYNFIYAILIIGLMVSCENDDNGDPNPDPEQSCIPANLQNGMIAFYPFQNGNLDDVSGNGNHLTLFNRYNDVPPADFPFIQSDRNGNANCAIGIYNPNRIYTYPGGATTEWIARDVLLEATNPFTDLNEFSVSIWYKARTVETREGGIYEGLVNLIDDLDLNDYDGNLYEGGLLAGNFYCPDKIGEWGVGLFDNRKEVFGNINSVWGPNTSDNNWKHIAATFNSGTSKIYINGILIETETVVDICGGGPATMNNVGELIIGYGYRGSLDDLILYDREISQAEVTQLYELDACCQ